MDRILSIFTITPVINYFDFFYDYILNHRHVSRETERSLEKLILNFERIGMAIITISYVLFILLEFYTHPEFSYLNRLILIIVVPVLGLTLFVSSEKTNNYAFLHTVYYTLLFLMIYYYPNLFSDEITGRSNEERFILHLSMMIAQSIRPGRFTGFPVLLFLLLHAFLSTSGFFLDHPAHINHLVFLAWTGGIAMFVESILYFNAFGYIELKYQKRREEEELTLAQNVYNHLFPKIPNNDNLNLFTYHSAENYTGGDFYDLIYLREGNIGFFLTDIAGHGVSSAMMSAAIKGIITGMPYLEKIHPESFLTYLDDKITNDYGSHHASAVYLFFDFLDKKLRLGNAGHPAILYQERGEPFQEISTKGSVIGFSMARPIAEGVTMDIHPGDRFLIYTDGLVEYVNKDGEIPDDVEMEAILSGLENLEGNDLIRQLLSKIETRTDFEKYRDDVMIVLLEIK